jgi:WD40 repeat protein
MSERISLSSLSSRSQSTIKNQDPDASVDAFVFDHSSGEGAFVLTHHLIHRDNEQKRNYCRGNVQVVNVRIKEESEWFSAYTVGQSVIFRSLAAVSASDEIGNQAKKLSSPKLSLKFKNVPVCQAFNPSASDADDIEMAIGFRNGSLFVIKPFAISNPNPDNVSGMSFNLDHGSAVTCIKWRPCTTKTFASSHEDGYLLFFDRWSNSTCQDDKVSSPRDQEKIDPDQNPLPLKRDSPVLRWKVSSSGITDFDFSSDGNLAVTAHRDGRAFVLDLHNRERKACLNSFYGGFTTVSWSPDDKFIVLGGEDDLISVWNVESKKLIARGSGHRCWISRASFHPLVTNGEYRIFSVGEDTRLAIWKFTDENSTVLNADKGDASSSDEVLLEIHPEGIWSVHQEPVRGLGLSYYILVTLCSSNQLKVWTWTPKETLNDKSLFDESSTTFAESNVKI